jgi:hypothetical protein
VTVSLRAGTPVKLFVGNHFFEVAPGQQLQIRVRES